MAEIRLKKRYKYVGDVFQELVEHAGFQPEVAAALLNDTPDAEVVPKAEIEQIFAEIEKFRDRTPFGYICFSVDEFEEIKKKYTEGEK